MIRWEVPSTVPWTITIAAPALDGVPCSIRLFHWTGWTVRIELSTRTRMWSFRLHGRQLQIVVQRENVIWTACGVPDQEIWTSQGWYSDAWWIDLRVRLLPAKKWARG